MSSTVLSIRIKDAQIKQTGDAIIKLSGTTPAAVVNALYACICETGEVPAECMRHIETHSDDSYERLLDLSQRCAVVATAPDPTPAQMREMLYE